MFLKFLDFLNVLQLGVILECNSSDLGQLLSSMCNEGLARHSSPTTLFDFYMGGRKCMGVSWPEIQRYVLYNGL